MAGTRRLAAIMFTDIVGYTALVQTDEAAALKLLDRHNRLLRPIFPRFHGREVKAIGDSFLVAFQSALDATNCAIEIQRLLYQENLSAPEASRVRVRIGIHLGDVVHKAGDVFGDSVNIASRIEPLAEPGGICITEPVFGQVRNKILNPLEKLGPHALKNVLFPMELYRVVLPWTVQEPVPESMGPTRLAILPLTNISPDPKDEYFADGLTEELIAGLSKLRELRVIARTSVGQYKATSKTVAQIGSELGVASVLEGSVRKAGNRVRITLQLIDAHTQEHIWANNYDRELDDVFAIQSDITERTAEALQIELLGHERESLRKKSTSSLDAYDLYLKGIHAAHQSTVEGRAASIQFIEEAIGKDPQFSRAYSALANCYISSAGETLTPREAFPRAKELIAKALELDPGSSDAHTARGNLALQYEHNWTVAESEFQRAISLNPSNANAHYWYSFLLSVLKRFEEASEQVRTTIELDPLWTLPTIMMRHIYTYSREFEKAIALTEEQRDRDPQNPGVHALLGRLYFWSGRIDDARKEAELSQGPVNEAERFTRAALSAELGKPEEARRLVRELEDPSRTRYVNLSDIAGLYAVLGEKERALDWLERDYQTGDSTLWYNYLRINFDPIRGDPRFRSMLKRLNLPTDDEGAMGKSDRDATRLEV